MWVRKESGGTTVNWQRVPYEWPDDGSVIEVPPEFGAELLGIRGGGFSEVPEPEQPEAITEPGPSGEITEPGPVATVTEGEGSQEPGEGGAAGPDGSEDDGGGGDPDGDPAAEGDVKPETVKAARNGRAKAKDAPEA
jgi:hypothetical protein